jgi:glucan biosynthesis protein
VEFQHAQLLNKREKAEELRGELAVKVQQRQLSLGKVRDLLHQQREKNQQLIQSLTTGHSEDKSKSVEATKEFLLLELKNDHDGHNLKKWRDWVQVKIQFLSEQGEHKRRECARLETIIEGYRTNMRLSICDSKEKDEQSGDVVVVSDEPMVMMECNA